MRKKNKKTRSRHGLQAVTLCISTAMVLVLLGLVVFAVCTARNLSAYVKQNIVVTMMLQDDMTSGEAQQFCTKLKARPYIHTLQYISKEQALREGIKELGTDPREFAETNPFLSSVEVTLTSDYANSDSLKFISKELKAYPKVSEVKYQKDLIDSVNANIAKISIVLLALAVLLTIVSFSLINNTVRLSIYARRFSIHTMSSWVRRGASSVRRSCATMCCSACSLRSSPAACWEAECTHCSVRAAGTRPHHVGGARYHCRYGGGVRHIHHCYLFDNIGDSSCA